MEQTHIYLAKIKGSDPDEFIFISTSLDGSQIKRMSESFSEANFRADMAAQGMSSIEISEKLAHARANAF
jgi:hypothetical protein